MHLLQRICGGLILFNFFEREMSVNRTTRIGSHSLTATSCNKQSSYHGKYQIVHATAWESSLSRVRPRLLQVEIRLQWPASLLLHARQLPVRVSGSSPIDSGRATDPADRTGRLPPCHYLQCYSLTFRRAGMLVQPPVFKRLLNEIFSSCRASLLCKAVGNLI